MEEDHYFIMSSEITESIPLGFQVGQTGNSLDCLDFLFRKNAIMDHKLHVVSEQIFTN